MADLMRFGWAIGAGLLAAAAAFGAMTLLQPAGARAPRDELAEQIVHELNNMPSTKVFIRKFSEAYPEDFNLLIQTAQQASRRDEYGGDLNREVEAFFVSFFNRKRNAIAHAPPEKLTRLLEKAERAAVTIARENAETCAQFAVMGRITPSMGVWLSDRSIRALSSYDSALLDAVIAGERSPVTYARFSEEDEGYLLATLANRGVEPDLVRRRLASPGAPMAERCQIGIDSIRSVRDLEDTREWRYISSSFAH